MSYCPEQLAAPLQASPPATTGGSGNGPFYGTFLEHWPAPLAALSMPQRGTVLNAVDADLIASCVEQGCVSPAQFSKALGAWLQDAVRHWPDGAFLRLGGRSFVTPGRPPAPVHTLEQALRALSLPGERAARMARRCALAGRPTWLFARQWRAMKDEEEFRLILRRRQLDAASQLHHRLCFPGLMLRAESVAQRIVDFASLLGAAMHLDDAVADVRVPIDTEADVELIELNPLMPITGRALLDDTVMGRHRRALHLRCADGSTAHVPLPARDSAAVQTPS